MAQQPIAGHNGAGQIYVPSRHPDRYKNIHRPYSPADVDELRPSVMNVLQIPTVGAEKFWDRMQNGPYMLAVGAVTGNQAVEMVKYGIFPYDGGWQMAFDQNLQRQTFPDMGNLSWDSPAAHIERIVNALQAAEQVYRMRGDTSVDWNVPLVADLEAGWGNPVQTFHTTTAAVKAGAAAVHLEDQDSQMRRCGHLGEKVVIPTSQHYNKLVAARYAMDTLGVPGVIIARTDSKSAKYISNDIDEYDRPFIDFSKGKIPDNGLYHFKGGLDAVIARGIKFAEVAEMIWYETNKLDLGEAKYVAEGIHEKAPWVKFAWNFSPSINMQTIPQNQRADFADKLAALGYSYIFVTVGGSHNMLHAMHLLARGMSQRGVEPYIDHQAQEFASVPNGYDFAEHQERSRVGVMGRLEEIITGKASNAMTGEGATSGQFRNP